MPDDTTPHGGEAMHTPPDRAKIPEPKPDARGPGDKLTADQPQLGANGRPTLPTSTEPMAADIEDEEADPVVEKGPGVADDAGDANDTGKASVTRQPGG